MAELLCTGGGLFDKIKMGPKDNPGPSLHSGGVRCKPTPVASGSWFAGHVRLTVGTEAIPGPKSEAKGQRWTTQAVAITHLESWCSQTSNGLPNG
jgi:hypothetical protein